jgi:hypothetical protein
VPATFSLANLNAAAAVSVAARVFTQAAQYDILVNACNRRRTISFDPLSRLGAVKKLLFIPAARANDQ